MAWYHVGGCDCPVGNCDCGPSRTYHYRVHLYNTFWKIWGSQLEENRHDAVYRVLANWDEIRKKRLVRKLGRKPKLEKLAVPITN